VLWGTVAQRPSGWNADAFRDENNHSLVLRVDFGEASFLIPGDIEHEAIEHLLEKHGSSVLDVDVLQVSHHGSSNGTTDELLTRVSPEIALLGTGDPSRREDWSAWQHGHPRQDVVDLLRAHVERERAPVDGKVAVGQFRFKKVALDKAVYATGWDGSVVVRALRDGVFAVLAEQ
jgi:competence protein ComEC